jgi:hypothetical protein
MVSGRYRSADIALVWTQVRPLTDGGISSKVGGDAGKSHQLKKLAPGERES